MTATAGMNPATPAGITIAMTMTPPSATAAAAPASAGSGPQTISPDCGTPRHPPASPTPKAPEGAISSVDNTAHIASPQVTAMIDKVAQDNLRCRILHAAGKLVRGGRRRRLKIPATWPWADAVATAWARITAPCHTHPDQRKATPAIRKEYPRGPWNPRPPARQPGHRHTPTVKSRTVQRLRRRPGPALRPRE